MLHFTRKPRGTGLSLFHKKLLRDIRTHASQVAAVLVIVALGTMILTLLLIVPRSLDSWLDRVFTRTRYEDFKVQVRDAPPTAVSDVLTVHGITAVEPTIEREATALVKGSELTVRVISVPAGRPPSVNRLLMESGGYPSAGGGVAVERHLARQFVLKPGDSLTLIVDGRQVALPVTGVGASPRFLRLVADQGTILSDPAQFGVVFMPADDVQRIFGTNRYNMFAFRVGSGVAPAVAMRAAAHKLEPFGIMGENTGADEQSTRLIMMDLNNMKNISFFFALVFLYVSSMAIYIVLARIIYTEQRQIGTARALGYGKSAIVRHFTEYGLAIGIAGGLLGAVGGVFMGRLTVNMYAGMIGLPNVSGGARLVDLVVLGVFVGILLSVVGAVLPARRSAKIQPAAAMRIDAGVNVPGPTIRAARRAQRRKIFPAWLRFPLRDLSRNRRRAALSAVALALTVATTISIAGALTSIHYLMDRTAQINPWDVAAYLPVPQSAGFVKKVAGIEGVVAAEGSLQSPARMRAAGRASDVTLQAYSRDTTMHGFFPESGKEIRPGPGGIVINRSLKRQMALTVGQTVALDTGVGTARFRVEGFVKEPVGVGTYVDLTSIQKMVGNESFNVLLMKTAPGKDDSVARVLRRLPEVNKVETKRGIFTTLDATINKAIGPMFNMLLLLILGIGFAIVFTMVSITVLERRSEIATMLTLGWSPSAVGRSFLVETGAISLGVLPFGIGLGYALCWVLMNKVLSTNTTQLVPEMRLQPFPIVAICFAFVALMAISVLPATMWLSKMDLATAARERTN